MKRNDMTESYSSQKVNEVINVSNSIRSTLSKFVGTSNKPNTFVSLGQNCSSAWYLKQVGLKTASYPFDWIFSSTEIVYDCIQTRFSRFLDRTYYIQKTEKSAGHYLYHSSLFNHRNPLSNDKDYNYYERTCKRFLEIIDSQEEVIYVLTLVNEPTKRPGWANGFTNHFPMPENQSVQSADKLISELSDKNPKAKFIVIDHYTTSNKRSHCELTKKNMCFIEFNALGRSTGVNYVSPLDDFSFKLMLSGLTL
ncbi:DUF1796 family putative cysteine peptidase [Agaribacter marinus]|uniref:Papain-like cysteine peptidase n=1 Tax=Agaribacter marinus TaxID=1431249 RepID=A0AA37WK20_9ALTE|nr:DUF1796 family putative cysteine peptidase [Agaribacter marinus]GLR70864.1 hypothetical protein GCM10007852_17720 [Agaribacter marinus]